MNKETHSPQVTTTIATNAGDIEVSSVHYTLHTEDYSRLYNETCVFYPNGESEVVGDYDDHTGAVTGLLDAVGALKHLLV
jgi:hypothetical protein